MIAETDISNIPLAILNGYRIMGLFITERGVMVIRLRSRNTWESHRLPLDVSQPEPGIQVNVGHYREGDLAIDRYGLLYHKSHVRAEVGRRPMSTTSHYFCEKSQEDIDAYLADTGFVCDCNITEALGKMEYYSTLEDLYVEAQRQAAIKMDTNGSTN